MYDKDSTNEEFRDLVQDVLVDVINSFSGNSFNTIKYDNEQTSNNNNQNINNTSMSDMSKFNTSSAPNFDSASAPTQLNQTTQPTQLIQLNDSPNIAETNDNTAKVSAIPAVEVINNDNNIGKLSEQPKVNTIPATNDINQKVSNTDQNVNADLLNLRNSNEAINISNTPNNVETNTISVFGTLINYSKNQDNTYTVSFDRNGVTRVSTLNSNNKPLLNVILEELEDFLAETLQNSNTVSDNYENIEQNDKKDNLNIEEFSNALDNYPEEEVKENNNNNSEDKTNATMASLRKIYAKKVLEIFSLGLKTKNAIMAESKDKFFAKDLKEYRSKITNITKLTAGKKNMLNRETEKYLQLRKDRDTIKRIVSIMSTTISNSQKALIRGYLTDDNSEKIIKTLQTMVSKLVVNYGKFNYSTILAKIYNQVAKTKVIIAKEIFKNRKSSILANKKSNTPNIKNKDSVRKITNNLKGIVREKNFVGSVTSDLKDNTKKNVFISSKQRENLKFNSNTDCDIALTNSNRNFRSNVKPRIKTNTINANSKIYGSSMRKPSVIVENNYIKNSNRTLANYSRHDGTEEMIGEISSLI